jgi:thiamine biosynthesis lipoprotein
MPVGPRLALLALLLLPAAGETATVTASATVLGQPLTVEIAAGAGADDAVRAGVAAAQEIAGVADPTRGPLGALNRAAGAGLQPVPADLLGLLQRALEFCRWSEGTYGPLGGHLHELWGLRVPVATEPSTLDLQTAAGLARCDSLQLDATARTAALSAGARLDLWGFAYGAAVDAAVERLVAKGVTAGSVTLGPVQRAFGSAPGGTGWPLRVVVPDGIANLTRRLELHDRAFALAGSGAGSFTAGGESRLPWLDHRTGRPGSGILATTVVSERAIDAEALAVTVFVTGNRRGAALLGQLRPSPAALWLLGGEGGGSGLVTDYRWGILPRGSMR